MRPRQLLSRWLVLLCIVFGLLTVNCGGGDNHEVVYLHVFNAYPGAESMSLYGPSGAIVTDLPFGVRTDEPVAVDRNLGTHFELVLDGAPTVFEIDQLLFNLYPQETGTFLVSRRQDNTAHAQILRHVQSIAAGCRLVFHNSLALSNDPLGVYHFIVGWNFHNQIADAGYDQQAEQDFIDEHEDMLDDQQIDQHDDRMDDIYNVPSGAAMARIDAHPVFALAESMGEEDSDDPTATLDFVWLGEEAFVDRPRVDFESGSIRTRPHTEDYLECLEEAIEAQEAMDDGVEDEQLQEDATQDCTEQQTYTTPSYGPIGDQVGGTLHYYPESLPDTVYNAASETFENRATSEVPCGADLRLYSDFANIFTGEPGFDGRPPFIEAGQPLAQNEDPLIRLFPNFSRSDHQFYVLYGRPVNPRILQWQASEEIHDMEPYPGD